jgi:hypothetical protein
VDGTWKADRQMTRGRVNRSQGWAQPQRLAGRQRREATFCLQGGAVKLSTVSIASRWLSRPARSKRRSNRGICHTDRQTEKLLINPSPSYHFPFEVAHGLQLYTSAEGTLERPQTLRPFK